MTSAPPPGADESSATGGPPASPATQASWGPAQVLIGVVSALFALLVAGGVVSAIDGAPNSDSLSVAAKLTLQGLTAIALLFGALIATRPGKLTPLRELGLGPSLVRPFKIAAMVAAVYVVISIVLSITIQPHQENLTKDLGYGDGLLTNIIVGFLVVIAAPISEEIFFRGLFFAGLRSRAPFAVAALFSSLFWAALHYTGSGSWGVVAQLAIFGILLSYLYEETGSIRPTIALHMLNNALAFAILVS